MFEVLRRCRLHFCAGVFCAGVLTALLSVAAPAASAASSNDGAAAASASDATGAAVPSGGAGCFLRRDWTGGWRVTPDARTIYIRVSGSIYRLDLQSSYSLLKDPFAILSDKDSADTICTSLDFRLTVSNQAGIEQWPIVKRMTRLTPQQAAALPKKLRP